jgi:hypothetical protein
LLENLTRLLGRPVEVVPMPVIMAYPGGVLLREGIKGMGGAAVCFVILVFLNPTPWLGWPIGVVGLLFFAYFGQQVSRHFMRLRVDESGLTLELLGGFRKIIRWSELSQLRLHFYPQAKGSGKGMLVLTLWCGKVRVKLDSSLDHFPTLLARAAQAARQRELELHPTTAENFSQLDL